jgi:hypothetical protein
MVCYRTGNFSRVVIWINRKICRHGNSVTAWFVWSCPSRLYRWNRKLGKSHFLLFQILLRVLNSCNWGFYSKNPLFENVRWPEKIFFSHSLKTVKRNYRKNYEAKFFMHNLIGLKNQVIFSCNFLEVGSRSKIR